VAATKGELSKWFDQGVAEKATHMVVVCDTFDWDDYPVFVKPTEDVREVAAKYNGQNMQKVMEVYSLRQDKAAQMAEHRAFHYD
jgi:hypothetical protein